MSKTAAAHDVVDPSAHSEAPTPNNPEAVQQAIALGSAAIAEGKTKVEAVRVMYPLIAEEPREIIWDAFVQGATLTPKGAITYLYNMKREARKPKKTKKSD